MKSKIIFLTLFFIITEIHESIPLFSESTGKEQSQQRLIIKGVLTWVNTLRVKHQLIPLRQSILLQKTAAKYAKEMVKTHTLSHTDSNGNRALERYREMGGSALRVGEIIGVGGNILPIENAWLKSPIHRKVILDPKWTEIGIGYAEYREEIILDVLFSENYIVNLRITESRDKVTISGGFEEAIIEKIVKPIMINGLYPVKPSTWGEKHGFFSFTIPKNKIDRYNVFIRLGYQDKRGQIIITNIIENLHLLKERNAK